MMKVYYNNLSKACISWEAKQQITMALNCTGVIKANSLTIYFEVLKININNMLLVTKFLTKGAYLQFLNR